MDSRTNPMASPKSSILAYAIMEDIGLAFGLVLGPKDQYRILRAYTRMEDFEVWTLHGIGAGAQRPVQDP